VDAFDSFSEEYLQQAMQSPRSAVGRAAVLSVLGEVSGLTALDLGCGPGLYAADLVARGAERVVGVDASPNMVRLASERVRGPVTFRQQNLEEPMSWAGDGEFDVAVLPMVLHHLDDRVGALREAARVLRSGGRLVVSTTHPTADWLELGGGYFTTEKVRDRRHGDWDVTYWRLPLEVICDEFREAGFLIERLHEPRPAAGSQEHHHHHPGDERLARGPGLIVFSLRKA
jgi:SAM-dependent methyltransferase